MTDYVSHFDDNSNSKIGNDLIGHGENAPFSGVTSAVVQTAIPVFDPFAGFLPSDDERLIANGYEPIAVFGKAPVGKEWQKRPNTTGAVSAERAAHPYATSTGLRTGRLVGIDIDTPRADGGIDHTAAMEALAHEVLGTTLRRVGAKGALLCYRNERPLPKIKIEGTHGELYMPDPKHPGHSMPLKAAVEILGSGRQFVAYGIHPETEQPYKWTTPGREPLVVSLAELPEVTPEKLRELTQRLVLLFTELGYRDIKVSDPGDPTRRAARTAKRRGDRAPVPEDELIEILSYIPPDRDRTQWIGYLGAIQATNLRNVLEDEMDDRLLEIAKAWSRGDYAGTPPRNWKSDGDIETNYWGLDPEKPGGTTFGTLYHAAKENGYTKPPPGPTPEEAYGAAAQNLFKESGAFDGEPAAAAPRRGRIVELLSGEGRRAVGYQWLWPGYLARKKFHILGGQKGAGKSTLTFDLFATLTTGGKWPDGTPAPLGDVLVWSSEDDFDDTILPRFLAAGGNSKRLFYVNGVDENGDKLPFDPARDMLGLIEAARQLPNLVAIMIDPVVSAVGGDSHKNAETRRGLQPLVDLAAGSGAALIGITHFTKNTSGRDPIERITGSLAFGALPRVVLGAVVGPDEHSPRRLVRIASNIGPGGGGFEYTVHQGLLAGHNFEAQRVIWGKRLIGNAKELLDDGQTAPSEKVRAIEFLKAQLVAAGAGGMPVADVKKAAEAHSLNWRTIERAKRDLGNVNAMRRPAATDWCWMLGDVESEPEGRRLKIAQ